MSETTESLLSFTAWKQRLVFWIGAISLGLLIVTMTLLSESASEIYRQLSQPFFWFNFIIAPISLMLAGTTFFPMCGTQWNPLS